MCDSTANMEVLGMFGMVYLMWLQNRANTANMDAFDMCAMFYIIWGSTSEPTQLWACMLVPLAVSTR